MPWDPVHDLLTMQERLESLFGRATPGWVPPVDLAEWPDKYVITAELPGLRRDQIHLDVEAQRLTIRGTRQTTCCPERYQQLERGQGDFSRSFQFSAAIEPDGIAADLVDGVLTVTVPKRGGRRIDIG